MKLIGASRGFYVRFFIRRTHFTHSLRRAIFDVVLEIELWWELLSRAHTHMMPKPMPMKSNERVNHAHAWKYALLVHFCVRRNVCVRVCGDDSGCHRMSAFVKHQFSTKSIALTTCFCARGPNFPHFLRLLSLSLSLALSPSLPVWSSQFQSND